MCKQNRVQKNRKAGASPPSSELVAQQFFLNLPKYDERCMIKKKMENKNYRNVKIFASAFFKLFTEYC